MTSDPDEKIRIMLVDDHKVVRQSLAFFIGSVEDFDLVGEASNGAIAVELCEQVRPHVILMDLEMPQMDGIKATTEILAAHPEIRIVVLTSFDQKEQVQAAIRAGALGYIVKNAEIDELVDAIRSAYAGEPVLSKEATQALMEIARRPPAANYNLTAREADVLNLLVQGLTNAEIGEKLSLSPFTIKTYVSDLLSKLGVSNRSEAISLALKKKLVRIDSPDAQEI